MAGPNPLLLRQRPDLTQQRLLLRDGAAPGGTPWRAVEVQDPLVDAFGYGLVRGIEQRFAVRVMQDARDDGIRAAFGTKPVWVVSHAIDALSLLASAPRQGASAGGYRRLPAGACCLPPRWGTCIHSMPVSWQIFSIGQVLDRAEPSAPQVVFPS